MQVVLITGGAGFIGSNFIPFYLEHNPNVLLVNLDILSYAGDEENLREVENHKRYTFVKGDICDRKLIEELFEKFDFKGVPVTVYFRKK